ncbi:hypothetical protein N7507_003499 [Penicillium longicatenatum]|nr:hypothetical protein N7507_003499 [Penicillium longicatenatum]
MPSSQQPQPAAPELMEIDSSPSSAPSSTQPVEQQQPATSNISSEGVSFSLSQSIHAPAPKTVKKAPRKASSRLEPSTDSSGSRKSRRIVERAEKANTLVNMASLERQLSNDNPTTSEPDNHSEFQPSSSALTDITNRSIFNTGRSNNTRKRRLTDATDGILTSKNTSFGPATIFNQTSTPKTRYSNKPSKMLRF